MNGSTILSDDTFTECTQDILGDVINNNDTFISENEGNDSATSYAILCNDSESSERSTLGNETEENLNEVNKNDDPRVILSNIRKKSGVIIGHININHLAGEFEDLKYLIKD